MNPNAIAMHPEDAREVLEEGTLTRLAAREKLVAGIAHDLVELSDFDVMRVRLFVTRTLETARAIGTARPLTSASLAAEQQAREQNGTR